MAPTPKLRAHHAALATLTISLIAAACDEPPDPEALRDELAASELAPGALPPSPTNMYADDDAAAELGRRLFFDRGLSENGSVACVDCHEPGQGFSDDRRRSIGTRGLEGTRHSMPVSSAALQPFLLWDGKADTVWRQPLHAIENELEMNLGRTEVAHFVAARHRADYEAVFGPMPTLDDLPMRARPGDGVWEALTPTQQDAVQRVFVNVGKALEAYERKLVCADTRFDRWLRGEEELDAGELDGAQAFVASGCTLCHDGPALSDGRFHNLGLSPSDATPIDGGREQGLATLLADPLNGASIYSDDAAAGAARLDEASAEQRRLGAFRTASLRGVTQRGRFGHQGDHTELTQFIDDVYRRGGGRGRGGDGDGRGPATAGGAAFVGELDPLLAEVDLGPGDENAIADFLGSLACPPVDPRWLAP